MNKLYFSVIILCFLFLQSISSQKIEYSVSLIPDSLITNANTIIRKSSIEITIEAIDKQVIRRKRIVTILNKQGDKNADLYQHYNNDTRINNLSVKIYDGLGNELKKYSKRKFIDVSAVDGGTLYSDAKVKYIDYTPTIYPYTVVFESEVQNSSTGFIPKWYPIETYGVSVEKSVYKINNPKNLIIRKKENNFNEYTISNLSQGSTIYYKLLNQPAKKYEQNSLAFFNIMPNLLVALNTFSLKGIQGNGSNWKEFGKWINNKLLLGKQKLNEATIKEVKELVKNTTSNVEKAKIIYKYMQDKTRYISVQIGIGGWAPIEASEVDKVGYGDCKGLTNYTKALLDAVGVTSNYTVVYAQKRRDIDKDFPSIQGNHIILNLPNNGNDIWLECTSQTMPFGFLGDFTDDRNVLVITPEGGVIKRTPAYKNETNLQTTKAKIILDKKGNITANVERISKGTQYDSKFHIEKKTEEDLIKYYKSNTWDYNNNLEIVSASIHNNKKDVIFTEKIKTTINEFASINDSEYLFRPNVFNKYSYVPKRYRNRTLPLKVSRGFLDKDEFTIIIPNEYNIDALPQQKELKTKFGIYKISITKIDDTTLLYKKYFLLKDGIYPKEDYKKYRKFLRSVSKLENSRIALIKK